MSEKSLYSTIPFTSITHQLAPCVHRKNSPYGAEILKLVLVPSAELGGGQKVVPVVGADAVVQNRVHQLVQLLLVTSVWHIETLICIMEFKDLLKGLH